MNGTPYRVHIPPRPTGGNYAEVQDADLARARTMTAGEVALGDQVLGDFPGFSRLHLDNIPARALVDAHHFTDPYWAVPQPAALGCGCTPCQAAGWALADGPLVKLADGFPWDGCDIYPPGELLLVAPYACACGCDTTLANDLTTYDWTSAASLQHLRETGRPLRPGEALEVHPHLLAAAHA
ncbi:hypothetical protein ABT224_20090 [Streptomyces sp. NPDC001584]|uniref:hypothetical protein n=1 Tax=Streptomyces sp. NPDC001584 TaxID=3154521 RepID=UPI00331E9FD1